MKDRKDKYDRPEAYPKPSETDKQLQNQPEYIDQEPNTFESEISDIPVRSGVHPDNERMREDERPQTNQ